MSAVPSQSRADRWSVAANRTSRTTGIGSFGADRLWRGARRPPQDERGDDTTAASAGSTVAAKIAQTGAEGQHRAAGRSWPPSRAVLQRHPDGPPQRQQHVVLQDEDHPDHGRADEDGERPAGCRAGSPASGPRAAGRAGRSPTASDHGGDRHRGRSWRTISRRAAAPAAGRKRTRPLRSPSVEKLASSVIGGDERRADADRGRRQPAGGQSPEDQSQAGGQAGAEDQGVRAAPHRVAEVRSAQQTACEWRLGAATAAVWSMGRMLTSGRRDPDVVDLEGRGEGGPARPARPGRARRRRD